MDEPTFKQVSKDFFKEMYFRLGGGEASGWTADYWRKSFEDKADLGWMFMVEEPRSAEHDRMLVVTDHQAREHRLFFVTDQSEEDFFHQPADE
ncbi:MAG TPA: hypothetical protein VF297_07425 [Pyrinomonadaceae bacterium]